MNTKWRETSSALFLFSLAACHYRSTSFFTSCHLLPSPLLQPATQLRDVITSIHWSRWNCPPHPSPPPILPFEPGWIWLSFCCLGNKQITSPDTNETRWTWAESDRERREHDERTGSVKLARLIIPRVCCVCVYSGNWCIMLWVKYSGQPCKGNGTVMECYLHQRTPHKVLLTHKRTHTQTWL